MTRDELNFTKHLHVHSRTHAHKQRNKTTTTTTTTTTRINRVVRVQAIQLAINNSYSEKKKNKKGIHVNLS